jgi:membrane-bound serine protease (ClpP class)
VHAVSAAHVVSALERAAASGAPLVVLRLDTPGGLDTSMRQIIDAMLNSRVPVAVFVGPSGARAASAGFLITVVADVAAMAPGTNIGAAIPVSGMGGSMDEVMSKKVTSDAAAYIRSKAERRGRNVELAEKAVVESKSFTSARPSTATSSTSWSTTCPRWWRRSKAARSRASTAPRSRCTSPASPSRPCA